jgi:hypothetical protein
MIPLLLTFVTIALYVGRQEIAEIIALLLHRLRK